MMRIRNICILPFLLLSQLACVKEGADNTPSSAKLTNFSFEDVKSAFNDPDMLYAPYCFWFWDEPLYDSVYPAKSKEMAREMLAKGFNPGYAHPRVSMADLQSQTPGLKDKMTPSPSLPKDEWLSPKWFKAYEGALKEVESANGYIGYVDEYMWPVGRAAGRVFEAHPELASANLQWEVRNVPGGTTVYLPPSFVTVAASIVNSPGLNDYTVTHEMDNFKLPWPWIDADPYGKESIGQTVVVEREKLVRVAVQVMCRRDYSDAVFYLEARMGGPNGEIVGRRKVNGGARSYYTVSLDIDKVLPVGTMLYIAMIPTEGFTENEISWSSINSDLDVKGNAYSNGKPVEGDRFLRLSYLTKPEIIQGEWINSGNKNAGKISYFRKEFELDGGSSKRATLAVTADSCYEVYINGSYSGEGKTWSSPGKYEIASYLLPGKNIIAVKVTGNSEPDALLCDLRIYMDNDREVRVLSDDSWKVINKEIKSWNAIKCNDKDWQNAVVYGAADAQPWDLTEAKLPFQKSVISSESLQAIGEGEEFNWTAPDTGDWRIYTFKKVDGGDVNVLDEQLASAFIELSHQPYNDYFKERMGKAISGVFCDTEGGYGNGNGLAWSLNLPKRYRSNTGRDIRLWLPLMLDDDTEGLSARARFDWFEAVSDLYSGFFAEINDWLTDRNMYYIVNVWEESLLWQASNVSDHMKVQRAFSMPGTDCLGLKAYDIHDFKETQSISEFEGRRLQSEIMGAGGWPTFSPVTMKECTNAVLAWGVNHIVPHGIFMSRALEGNVWVPDWYNRNPMWANMKLYSDFVRRASFINSQGHVEPDVLLYNPMSSIWALLGKTDMLWWSPLAGNVGYTDELYSEEAREINRVYSDAMRKLSKHRVEYLIGDRHYVNKMSVKGNFLRYNDFNFTTVVLPPMVVLPLSVAEKILEFAKSGGMVYTLGMLPYGSTENGLYDPEMEKIIKELVTQPNVKECDRGLEHELMAKAAGLSSTIQFASGEFQMLQLHREIDGKHFFWLVNNSETKQKCQLSVIGITGTASIWDCEKGEIIPISSDGNGENTWLSLTFKSHEAFWLVIDPEGRPEEAMGRKEFDKVLITVEGKWNITIDETIQPEIEHRVEIPEVLTGPGLNRTLTLWEEYDEIPERFSGLVDYAKTVELPEFEGELQLDLGKVYHCAEVWINGKRAGAKLWPPHQFTTDLLKSGTNEITIRVGNLVNSNYGMDAPSGFLGPVSIMKVE